MIYKYAIFIEMCLLITINLIMLMLYWRNMLRYDSYGPTLSFKAFYLILLIVFILSFFISAVLLVIESFFSIVFKDLQYVEWYQSY